MDKILCTIGKSFSPQARAILATAGNVAVIEPTRRELMRSAKNCTAIMTQLGLHIDRAVIDAAPHLRVIATATTGTNHIDVTYARKKGIAVLSLRGERAFLDSITSTAELAIGLMIALERNLVAAAGHVKEGRWEGARFCGHSLSGKTLGIVGLGRLGSMVARAAAALGMRVWYADPHVKTAAFARKTLRTLLRESDIVSLHLPLDAKTGNFLSAAELALMKRGALLINTSRGEIVDEDAVLAALRSGALGGYAADVLGGEHAFEGQCANHPLVRYARRRDNVLLTPHIGGRTVESREQTDVFMAGKLRDFLRH